MSVLLVRESYRMTPQRLIDKGKYWKAWLWIWLCEFLGTVWRKDEYFLQGQRRSIKYAAFVAKVVADTCMSIRASWKG